MKAVRKIPTQFKTSDGQRFDTEKEAQGHQALIDAEAEYRDARRQLGKLLAKKEKTADGVPFDISWYGDYYFVTPGYSSIPQLIGVGFFAWNFEFDDRQGFILRMQRETTNGTEWRTYRISNLYKDKRKAETALLLAQKKWLADRAEEIAEFEKQINGEGR